MARRRRTYTPEFKVQAVRLVTEHGYSIAEAARSLGVFENLTRAYSMARNYSRHTKAGAACGTRQKNKS
jgi:transposase-like protein